MSGPTRVLVADDDPVSQTFYTRLFQRWGYEVVGARSGDDAWEILAGEEPPQMAMLDWEMPGLTGLECCRRARERVGDPYLYIILLTRRTDTASMVEGMTAGADDFVSKGTNVEEVRVRMRAGQRIVDLHRELVAARDTFKRQASQDVLTGLLSRRAILERLSRQQDGVVGILLLDVDRFKSINDSLGHDAGDVVLQEVANRIERAIRTSDVAGRYGGEEFLVVLPDTNPEALQRTAERVREAIAGRIVQVGGAEVRVTASVGATVWRPGVGSHEEAIRTADAALYAAKRAGRDVVCFQTSPEEKAEGKRDV